jgi:hypothetical protein
MFWLFGFRVTLRRLDYTVSRGLPTEFPADDFLVLGSATVSVAATASLIGRFCYACGALGRELIAGRIQLRLNGDHAGR